MAEGVKAMEIVADLNVDFMRMSTDRRVLTRLVDARPGYEPRAGSYAVVSDDDAEPMVAHILSVAEDGVIEVQVLAGTVEANRHLLGRT